MTIFFISTWWPNDKKFSGIFVKEQARSVALYHELHALNVKYHFDWCFIRTPFKVHRLSEHQLKVTEVNYYLPPIKIIHNRWVISLLNRLNLWLYKRYARRMFKENKFDLIHLNNFCSEYEFLFNDSPYKDIPKVLSEHNGIYLPEQNRNIISDPESFRAYTRHWLNHSDLKCIMPVSKLLQQTLIELYNIRTRQVVIPNVIHVNPGKTAHTDKKGIHICLIAHWQYPKNPGMFFRAMMKLPEDQRKDIHITMGGIGRLYDEIKKQYEQGELSVQFVGILNKEAVLKLLTESDLLVHPTSSETFSCIVAEALCCGTPVLSNRTGVISEVVNENNGAAVEIDNEDAFFEALVSVLKKIRNKEFNRKEISGKYRRQFSSEQVGQLISDVYDDVLSTNPASLTQ